MLDEMTLTGAADITATLFVLAFAIYWLANRRKRAKRWQDIHPWAFRDYRKPVEKRRVLR
jgi:hypothetical protein